LKRRRTPRLFSRFLSKRNDARRGKRDALQRRSKMNVFKRLRDDAHTDVISFLCFSSSPSTSPVGATRNTTLCSLC
jgi:hypothetical protein